MCTSFWDSIVRLQILSNNMSVCIGNFVHHEYRLNMLHVYTIIIICLYVVYTRVYNFILLDSIGLLEVERIGIHDVVGVPCEHGSHCLLFYKFTTWQTNYSVTHEEKRIVLLERR